MTTFEVGDIITDKSNLERVGTIVGITIDHDHRNYGLFRSQKCDVIWKDQIPPSKIITYYGGSLFLRANLPKSFEINNNSDDFEKRIEKLEKEINELKIKML